MRRRKPLFAQRFGKPEEANVFIKEIVKPYWGNAWATIRLLQGVAVK